MLASARPDRVMDAMLRVQQTRAWVEDVQDGMLHFAALPTRQDVRQLQRKVDLLRRRVSQLDLTVTEIERGLMRDRTREESSASASADLSYRR